MEQEISTPQPLQADRFPDPGPAPVNDQAAEAPPVVGENRRIHPRVEFRVEVTLTNDSNFYLGFSENISNGGLFVGSFDYPLLPIGRKLTLTFTVPSRQRPIQARGEVRWLREYSTTNPDLAPGMGVRFLDLNEEDQADIQEFVKVKEPLFYDDGTE